MFPPSGHPTLQSFSFPVIKASISGLLLYAVYYAGHGSPSSQYSILGLEIPFEDNGNPLGMRTIFWAISYILLAVHAWEASIALGLCRQYKASMPLTVSTNLLAAMASYVPVFFWPWNEHSLTLPDAFLQIVGTLLTFIFGFPVLNRLKDQIRLATAKRL